MASNGIEKSKALVEKLDKIQAQSRTEAEFVEKVMKLVVEESLNRSRELTKMTSANVPRVSKLEE